MINLTDKEIRFSGAMVAVETIGYDLIGLIDQKNSREGMEDDVFIARTQELYKLLGWAIDKLENNVVSPVNFKPAAFRLYTYDDGELQEIFETPDIKTLFSIIYFRYDIRTSKKEMIRDLSLTGISVIKYGFITLYLESYTRFEFKYPNLAKVRHNLMPLTAKYPKIVIEELFSLAMDPASPDCWTELVDEALGQFDIPDLPEQIASGEFEDLGNMVYIDFDLDEAIKEGQALYEDTKSARDFYEEPMPFYHTIED